MVRSARWLLALAALALGFGLALRERAHAGTLIDDFSSDPFGVITPPPTTQRWCERFHHVHWDYVPEYATYHMMLGTNGDCCEGINFCGGCGAIYGASGSCNGQCAPLGSYSAAPGCKHLLISTQDYVGVERRATIAFGLSLNSDTTAPPCTTPTPSVRVATAAHPHCETAFEARVIPLSGGGGQFGLEIRSVTTPLAGFSECGSGSTPEIESSVIDAAATFIPTLTITPQYELSLATYPSELFPNTKISAVAEVFDRTTGTRVAVAAKSDFTRPGWYDKEARRFAFGGSFPMANYPASYDDFDGATTIVPPDPTDPLFSNGAPLVVDPTVPTNVKSSTEFLYAPRDTETPTIQAAYDNPAGYINADGIELSRAAVIRGRVLVRDSGSPLSGVSITIKDHSEFGRTHTRADGRFDIAVSGGGPLTVVYERPGFLGAHRQVVVPWSDYVTVPDVALVEQDIALPVALGSVSPQLVQASLESDADGTRRAGLFFPSNTTATVQPPEGSPYTLTGPVQVHATEYTVGSNGPKAMPAELPANTAYTYAAELGIDEAGDGAWIDFNQDVIFYVDHFLANLGFPFSQVEHVPAGYYDRTKSAWVPSANGRILRIVGRTGLLADLDLTGDSVADPGEYGTLGISDAEREALGSSYATDGSVVLWRVPVRHFSAWDLNWGYGVPPGGGAPDGAGPNNHGPPPGPTPCEPGSVIACTTQALGESLPVTGTAYRLHYASDRVYGRAAGRRLTIYFGSTAPGAIDEFRGVEIEIRVAGKLYVDHLAAIPTSPYEFDGWDGKDAFGREINGGAPTQVRVGYTYQGAYRRVEDFGHHGNGTQITGSRTRQTLTLWQSFDTTLESWDARGVGIGAWTFNVQHVYDPTVRVLRLGNGRRRSFATQSPAVTTRAWLAFPYDVAVASDETAYVSHASRVVRVKPDGTVEPVAGQGSGGCGADDGLATAVLLDEPRAIALGPDGNLYVADKRNHKVYKIFLGGPMVGQLTTVVGRANNCQPGFSGDDGPAENARLDQPVGLAVSADGSIYVADTRNRRIRKVSPDGVIRTVAGTGGNGDPAEGQQAVSQPLRDLHAVAVDREGEVYFTSDRPGGDTRVLKVTRAGSLQTVAGVAGQEGNPVEGQLATQTSLLLLEGLSVGADGSLFITDRKSGLAGAPYVLRVGPDGILRRIAGQDTTGFASADGSPALLATFNTVLGTEPGPDGSLYIVDQGNHRVCTVDSAATGLSTAGYEIASEDGREVYVFAADGRHQRTRDALTGANIYLFGYDAQGRLRTITDRSGKQTQIHQPVFTGYPFTGSGTIEAPGHGLARDQFALNVDGYLSSFTNPANEQTQLTYTSGGLLTQMTDPRGHTYKFSYDAGGKGYLVKDADPVVLDQDPNGFFKMLTRSSETSQGFTVDLTTALGRVTRYIVATLGNGATELTKRDPAGLDTVTVTGRDDTLAVTLPGAPTANASATLIKGPDPRFGMQAPLWKRLEVKTPAAQDQPALTAVAEEARSATTDQSGNLLTWSDEITINGDSNRIFRRAYNGTSRTITDTTPVGRTRTLELDQAGRVIKSTIGGLHPVSYGYDSEGRLATISQGPAAGGPETRTSTLGYDALHRLVSITNPLSEAVTFLDFDGANRARTQRLPGPSGPRDVLFTFDANGNMTSLSPPARPAHGFAHTKVDLEALYDPPQADPPLAIKATAYAYDLDRQLELVTRPSPASPSTDQVDLVYESATARLEKVVLTERNEELKLTYDSTAGRVETASGPAAVGASNPPQLRYSYSGFLPIATKWECKTPPCPAGTIEGEVSRTYDSSFRAISQKVNAAHEATFTYDNDDLLTGITVGGTTLTITRDPQKGGLITGSSIPGSVQESRTYNEFGELASQTWTYGSTTLYAVTYDDFGSYRRDKLGRILRKTESIAKPGGGPNDEYVWDYTYDSAGRLATVTRNGTLVSEYEYDANGNRLAHRGTGGVVIAEGTYDNQDRLLTYGLPPAPTTYEYTANGELASKTDATGTTTYEYDPLGNLRRVTPPSGPEIEYVVDGQGRRIGRKIGGTLQTGYRYDGQLRIVAELDGSGAVLSRFVYGTQVNVPELIVKAGAAYRLITDHLGSVRLVVDAATGTIAQRIDYNEFGAATLAVGTWEVQPFNFAGGLYDWDVYVIRFGARDYDPSVGRWVARDPVGFGGRLLNLFSYAGSDPLDSYDPSGLGHIWNNSPVPIPITPENQPRQPVFLPPGDHRDVEGFWNPPKGAGFNDAPPGTAFRKLNDWTDGTIRAGEQGGLEWDYSGPLSGAADMGDQLLGAYVRPPFGRDPDPSGWKAPEWAKSKGFVCPPEKPETE